MVSILCLASKSGCVPGSYFLTYDAKMKGTCSLLMPEPVLAVPTDYLEGWDQVVCCEGPDSISGPFCVNQYTNHQANIWLPFQIRKLAIDFANRGFILEGREVIKSHIRPFWVMSLAYYIQFAVIERSSEAFPLISPTLHSKAMGLWLTCCHLNA